MKKEAIENRDQELIKKFRTIIHNKKEKPAPKTFPFGLLFLFAALIISSMLLLPKQQPASLVSKAPETSDLAQPAPVPAEQSTSNATTVEITAPADAPKVPTDAPKIPAPRQKNDMPSGIRIEEIISCDSVNNKQYSRPKVKFSLSQDATPTIWMKVISENPPSTLTHVYYFNGQKYCEVPLAIRYHRMRTWSSVTLRSPEHIGKWRVEVVANNGAKLTQIEFIVVK